MSSCKYSIKYFTITIFNFNINSMNLSSTKMLKDVGAFIAEYLK